MFDSIGREVEFLKRVEIAGIRMGGLGRGEVRYLTDKEVELLMRLK
jgi:16S rRNA U516 pseudouridylate synthase RsuA-like enzyme